MIDKKLIVMSTFITESDNTTALEQPSNSPTTAWSNSDLDDTLQIKFNILFEIVLNICA
jgi:hypothetical protein